MLPTRPTKLTGSLPHTQRLLRHLPRTVRLLYLLTRQTRLTIYLVGRHMNHLSVSAPNPTYLQRTYLEYNSGSQYQPAPAPSPLSEYSHELSYLSTTSMPTGDSRYWHNTRDDSVRLLSEGGSYVKMLQSA